MCSRGFALIALATCVHGAEGSGLPNPAFLAPYSGARDYAVRSTASSVIATYWVAASATEVSAHHGRLLTGAGFSVTTSPGGSLSAAAKGQAATVRIQQSDLGTNVTTRYTMGAAAATTMARQVRAEAAAANVTASQAYAWPAFLTPPPGDEFPRPPEVSSNPKTGARTLKMTFGSGEDLQTIIGFYERLLAQNGLTVCCTAMSTATTMSGRKGFRSGHTEGTQYIAGGKRRISVGVSRGNLYGYFQITLEVTVTPGA